MGEEENAGPKPNKANVDDEFLRHPHSGAFVRNPLKDKSRSLPVLFQAAEFEHNCLGDALQDWHCIQVSEASLRELTSASGSSGSGTLQRAALSRLRDLPTGYEFVVNLKRSTYQPPKHNRRRPIEPKTASGIMVDKVCIEVTDLGSSLRIESINEGLVAVWNRTHPVFQVKPLDCFASVNDKKDAATMLEELNTSENLKITVRRPPTPAERRNSKLSVDLSAAQEGR
mmetsp:Transcript_28325/g.64150  ORF Transcript_28325/g.64150 Transcript_28325/m.64150 type:complete len:228 (+) Transcript_28325:64-747(+)